MNSAHWRWVSWRNDFDFYVNDLLLYVLHTQHAFESNNLLGLIYKIVQQEIPKIPNIYSADLNE